MVALWMPWIRLRQRQRFGTSTLARPASLHPVLGSSLGTDLIFELGPNLKNLRLDARPCSAGRHASHGVAQSSKRNRLTVGCLAGWAAPNGGPLDAMDSAQAAAAIRYIYTRTACVASSCARLISGNRPHL